MGCGCRSIRITAHRRQTQAICRWCAPTYARTAPANTLSAPTARPDVLNDHGVRRLAIAVLQQAVADLHSPIPEHRSSAAAFIERREDLEFWCTLAGLDGDAVREELGERNSHHEEAA